ncbi:MAG: hypothetical protein IPM39_12795 [Chloroflexi bacterium]|nr:hypothetical protein [Chloroflexota bacterium]
MDKQSVDSLNSFVFGNNQTADVPLELDEASAEKTELKWCSDQLIVEIQPGTIVQHLLRSKLLFIFPGIVLYGVFVCKGAIKTLCHCKSRVKTCSFLKAGYTKLGKRYYKPEILDKVTSDKQV